MKSISLFFGKMTLEKKALLLTLTPILTVLLNTKPMLIGLGILIIIDMVTGIRKSLHEKKLSFNPFKSHFWKTVHSKGMRDTWRKTYEYGVGVIVFAVFESMVLKLDPFSIQGISLTLTELAVVTATLVEIYSIFENMEAVSGNNILKRITFLLPAPIKKLLGIKENEESVVNVDHDVQHDFED